MEEKLKVAWIIPILVVTKEENLSEQDKKIRFLIYFMLFLLGIITLGLIAAIVVGITVQVSSWIWLSVGIIGFALFVFSIYTIYYIRKIKEKSKNGKF